MLEQEHSLPSVLRNLSHGHAEEISPKLIQEAASKGDRVAKTILDETGFYLGFWLAGMISLFDPDAIVIGGGVSLPAPEAHPIAWRVGPKACDWSVGT